MSNISKYLNALKISLKAVATSGSYTDLTDRPTLGTAAALNVGNNAAEILRKTNDNKYPEGDGSLITNIQSASTYIGDYKASIKSANHGWWILCNGQTLSRTTYNQLFTLIGTSFGVGDGSTTFTLPDFRGRVFGTIGQGVGLTNRILGQSIGGESHTLSINEMPAHNHSANIGTLSNDGSLFESASGTVSYSISTNNTGGGQPHNNMQPTLFGGNIFIYSGA